MSEKKRKRIALGSTLFFHGIIISLCFFFKIGYSADKEKEDFSDIIYFSTLSSLDNAESEIEKQEYQEYKQQDLDQEYVDQPDLIDDVPQLDPRIADLFQDQTKKENIKGCVDKAAVNYNSLATEDDGSCKYKISNPGESAEILLDGKREKLQGGDLKYPCEAKNTAVIYTLLVIINKDGDVRVDKCENISGGNGNTCFKDAAIYAAETMKFSALDKNDNSLGTPGKIIYTFSPETKSSE